MPKCDFNKVAANLQESTDAEKCDFNKVAKLLCNFIGITLRHGCSPVNLLHIFRTFFPDNTTGGLLLGDKNGTLGWNGLRLFLQRR